MIISLKIFRALAFGCAMLLLANSSFAQSRVVVIPMSGDDLKPLQNIITVAKENGDFADPVAAMASISDAAVDNPYLLVIAPGDYALTSSLVMQPYVDIAGSGRNVTRLIADNIVDVSYLVTAADQANLKDLSLIGIDGSVRFGISNDGGSQVFSNLSIRIEADSGVLVGLYNQNSSQAIIKDSSIELIGGSGSSGSWGIANVIASTITVEAVTIVSSSSGVLDAIGVFTSADSPAIIRNSNITAESPVSMSRSTAVPETSYIANTFVHATRASDAITAPAKCTFVFDENGDAYDADCNPIAPAP